MIIRLGRTKPRRPQAVLRGWRAFLRLLMLGGVLASPLSSVRAELPVPCGGCAGGVWVASGQVQAPVIAGNAMSITQQSDKAILNWQSFNVGADNSVTFVQPSSNAVALNRIYQNDPSRILGRVSANGQIYLINRNGIVFGQGSQVDAHTLVASTLDVADDVLESGIFAPRRDKRPAFALAQRLDADGKPVPGGVIQVEPGALLSSAKYGRIMLLAPEVENRGTLRTPDGQVILAAGERVWVTDSDDDNLRGLMVEVDVGGEVRNLGEILVERGNASLVGLAVNQGGRISAKTAVNLGGSIHLVARDAVDDTRIEQEGLIPQRAGAVVFGAGSVTEVLPDYADPATAIDEQAQPASMVQAMGKTIDVQDSARVTATGGAIDFTATTRPGSPLSGSTEGNGARIDIAAGATLDVSGTRNVALPMERNVVTVELRGNELKDSPLQRDGILYGKKIKVDVREGTPIADISGALANVQRGVGERTTAGGTITLRSEDALRVGAGATLDVSGGSVRYEGGAVETTKLVADGRIYDIADADPNLRYEAVLTGYTRTNKKWGVTKEYALPGLQSLGTFEDAYVEGKDAGGITLLGDRMEIAGALKGNTIKGPRQRELPSAVDLPWRRPTDELAYGGRLILGDAGQLGQKAGSLDFRLPGVLFGSADGSPAAENMLVLDPALFETGGLSRVAIYSDGRIVLPDDERIALAPGGELTLVAGSVTGDGEDGSIAPALRIDGDIAIPSGALTLRTVQSSIIAEAGLDARHVVAIGADAVLDVGGQWVNDTAAVAPTTLPSDPIVTDGGRITVSSVGGVDIADGARLLLNGGAWLDRGGTLNAGTGGDLTIASSLAVPPTLHLGGTAESYGLVKGGTLDVTAAGIEITDAAAPGVRDGVWTVNSAFFQQGGFSHYRLTSSHRGLKVAEGTRLAPRALNWVLDAEMSSAPTGTPFSSLARLETLPDYLRAPVDLRLESKRSSDSAELDADLVIAAGAAINADAGANIALRSDRMLTVEGAVHAPAGTITLNLGDRTTDRGLFPDKAIWLGPNAVLAAPAAVRLTPHALGLRQGEVLDGGRVTLRAGRGLVVTAPGSLIDVGGAAASLDLVRQSAGGGAYQEAAVAGAAGDIRIEAAEGVILAGGLRAQAAEAPGAAGGRLAVTLGFGVDDPVQPNQEGEFKRPGGAHEIALLNGDPAALLGELRPGDALFSPQALAALRSEDNRVAAVAALSLQNLEQAGLDVIDLQARPAVRESRALDDARIRFDIGAQLRARRRITLDAPIVMGSGGDALIEAAHIALGPTDRLRYAEAPAAGPGTFTARADLIDITGDLALQGYGAAGAPALALESRGDVRLSGLRIPLNESDEVIGSLKTAGEMRIDAAQLYPTTLTAFTLAATGEEATVTLGSAGAAGPAAIPLSAGGALTIEAANIDVAGTVRAPHGRITLRAADRLTLADGAVVSVAGPAQPVPYGQTQFGRDWVLPYELLLRVLGGPEGVDWSVTLPEKTVELVADKIDLRSGAQVVLDGGGDLHAWEFIPGPGGSKDVLLAENAGGAYAIVPTAQLPFAPLDPFSQYQGLETGDTLEIAHGIDGLPAGEYALLPARYALLPGALLLTPHAGRPGLAATETATTPAGLPIVAARRGAALGGTHESLWSNYVVENGPQLRRRAEYRESLASDFFKDIAAGAQMPADAGRLLVDAGSRLSLGAAVGAAGSGRGGQVDIVADRLAVVETASGNDDRVELLADGLAQLRVESLLLGGRRERTTGGTRIEVAARGVSIESGVDITLPEIMLVAAAGGADDVADGVRVAAGASLRGVGAEAAAPTRFLVEGDSALLRVSSGHAATIERSGVPAEARARLVLEQGSTLAAGTPTAAGLGGGSITLDSSGDAGSAAGLDLGAGGALQLAASRIGLGDIPTTGATQGLALSQTDLAGLDVSNLFLKSASSLDLYGEVDFAVDGALVIEASALRGIANGHRVDARLSAGTLSWKSGEAAVESTAAADLAGRLTLAGGTVTVGDIPDAASTDEFAAALAVQGYAVTRLQAASGLIVQGDGRLQAPGELQLAAPWLSTSDGADWRIDAGGALAVGGGADGIAPPAAPGLGSRLALTGTRVAVDGGVLLPAGSLALHAAGADAADGIRLTERALIDVAALRETFLDQTLATPGGRVTLTAERGGVVMDPGARIDVSGAGGALTLRSAGRAVVDGELVADAGGEAEGSFSLTAQGIDDFSALNDRLNAGGFGAARHFRLRSGDATIAGGETLRARDVAIVLDGEPAEGDTTPTGSFALGGTIDAAGERAGRVRIHARGDVTLAAGARIDAHAVGEDRQGGKVELATTEGVLSVAEGAVVDVRGTREVSYERPLLDENGQAVQRTDIDGNPQFDPFGQPLPALERITVADTGEVRYRAPRAALADGDTRRPSLGGTVLGAGRVELEAFQTYTDADGRLDDVDVAATAANPLYQDAADLMAREADIRAALGVAGDARFHLVPGVEVRSDGDLTLTSAWDLAQWRFGAGNEAGVLSLRAGGDIELAQSLGDGVQRVLDPIFSVEKDMLLDEASWSLRLAAGADLVSVDPLAVKPGSGDLVVGAGAQVRTGTGDIELRAGRDLVLSDTASVIYTAGLDAGIGTLDPTVIAYYLDGVYPMLGGDVDIVAHGNVDTAPSDQLINDWLWRIEGSPPDIELPRSWNVNLTHFRQGVAAFGGGTVSVTAGGDVRNLSAAVPTTGRQVGANRYDPLSGGFSVDTDEVVVQGGDALTVRAGGDIVGGVYHLGRGLGELTAGGSITRRDATSLYPMLGLGDGRWQATAGRRAAVETVFNPTLVTSAPQQGPQAVGNEASGFLTYADDSALHLTALAREARLNQNSHGIRNHPFLANGITELQLGQFRLYPGSLLATSFRDDVVIANTLELSASPQGQLSLFADGDVRAESDSVGVTMLDAVNAPPIHGDDPQPARIAARRGDIGGARLNLYLPKAAWLDAGRDIRNLDLKVQHLRDQDVTVLRAGGSIVHETVRQPGSGRFSDDQRLYRIEGPGRVDFMAGGDIDLGTAVGIWTTGNKDNPYLPDGGAAVTLAAGLREPPRFDAFIDKYLAGGPEYAAALTAYLERYETAPALSAIDSFRALPAEQQRPFLWQVFFAELRASGVEATAGSNDYSRGYAAIETLFPEQIYPAGQVSGDLSLLLSQITTLDGGGINILLPGGAANAGVATSSQLFKLPGQLGIVVQRSGDINAFVRDDFVVNQSRVFTLDGGDLLMWSSLGDIDAGRGAKSAIAAPKPISKRDDTGKEILIFPPAISGSGIRAVVTSEGVEPGDVYLFAPAGVVSAGDAGIGSAGNVTIGAVQVIGADNIDVGGVAVGVPAADPGSLTAGTAGMGDAAGAAAKTAEESATAAAPAAGSTPIADAALNFLEVEVLGFGEDRDGKKER